MKIEVVWIAFDGHYVSGVLENVVDIRVYDGIVSFLDNENIMLGISTNKLVRFERV